jgi:membrane protein YdbS with pleckstrin-like domain
MPNHLITQLREIALFARLGREDLRAISKLVKQEEHPAGTVVGRQGETGQTAYVVESGELHVRLVDSQGIERVVTSLGPGDFFGEASLLLGEPRDATVEVAQDATLLSLSKEAFDVLLDERPDILRNLEMRPDVRKKREAALVHFKWLDDGEVVVMSEHRHDALFFRSLVVPCFSILVFLIGGWYLSSISEMMLPLIVGWALCAVVLVFIVYLFMDHRDDRYIVTNKRVARREHSPLGRESRVDAPLHTIQDIQESQIGMLAQVFHFGDLIIETAGERGHVAFREIPNPDGVREIIFEQIRRAKSQAKVAERDAIRDDLREYFGIQAREEEIPAPPPPSEAEESKRNILRLLFLPVQVVSYFLPRLRDEQGDTITWRKHWIALIKPIALPTILMFVFTIGAIALLILYHTNLTPTLIGYGTSLVILFPWWLWKFDDWQNDIYQVTYTRIIDVERLPFYLREDRREASLGVIQNVQFEVPGALAKFLNYGSVTIETAGVGAFTFDLVKDPSGVQAEIFRRMEAFRKSQAQTAAEQHRQELLDWFAVYDQLREAATPTPHSPVPQQEA